MNQLSLSQAMQLRSGRRLDPPPPPGRPRRRRAPRRRPEAGGVVEEVDRISSLPDDLLLDILSRLGCAREAARTSVLAKRWRGLWTQLSKLKFGDVPLITIEGLLAQVTHPVLNLLHIDRIRPEASFRVSSLLRAAERLAPKNLYIGAEAEDGGDEVELPCFDRTTSLKLCLPEIILTPPPAGEFTALRSLTLDACSVELDSLLPMCPSLRSLHFTCHSDFDVVIVHSTLEKLYVEITDSDGIANMEIVTPLLKKATFKIFRGKDFSMSFSAPRVKEINWHCECYNRNVGLENMRLCDLTYYYLSHGVRTLRLEIRYEEYWQDVKWSFEEVIEQLPFSQFSVLELDVETEGHGFGPLLLNLPQIRPVRKLEVTLKRAGQVSCPLDCPCDQHTNWRDESISLTELEVVKIRGFKGEDDEADFLKVLFRCAAVLKSMTVEVAAGGYNKVYDICVQYPHVKCDVSARK